MTQLAEQTTTRGMPTAWYYPKCPVYAWKQMPTIFEAQLKQRVLEQKLYTMQFLQLFHLSQLKVWMSLTQKAKKPPHGHHKWPACDDSPFKGRKQGDMGRKGAFKMAGPIMIKSTAEGRQRNNRIIT